MLALFARERTGRGQHVDVAYLDTMLSLLAARPNMRFFFSDGLAPRRGEGFLGGSYPYYAIYETRDGKLLTIGCTEPWLWENFCKALGRPAITPRTGACGRSASRSSSPTRRARSGTRRRCRASTRRRCCRASACPPRRSPGCARRASSSSGRVSAAWRSLAVLSLA